MIGLHCILLNIFVFLPSLPLLVQKSQAVVASQVPLASAVNREKRRLHRHQPYPLNNDSPRWVTNTNVVFGTTSQGQRRRERNNQDEGKGTRAKQWERKEKEEAAINYEQFPFCSNGQRPWTASSAGGFVANLCPFVSVLISRIFKQKRDCLQSKAISADTLSPPRLACFAAFAREVLNSLFLFSNKEAISQASCHSVA